MINGTDHIAVIEEDRNKVDPVNLEAIKKRLLVQAK
mgnify:CR=1 FL=1